MQDNASYTCNYKVDSPYPPIRVEEVNCIYANEMLSNMAGVVSEMSDISRYFYNAVMLEKPYNSFSTCFHHISIVEMHHLNMFAEFALLLGEDPRLWCGTPCKRYWSPSYISHPREIQRMLADSIQAEENAIQKYSRQANTICDTNIVAVLNRIIQDEERHIQIFKEMCLQL